MHRSIPSFSLAFLLLCGGIASAQDAAPSFPTVRVSCPDSLEAGAELRFTAAPMATPTVAAEDVRPAGNP